MKPAAKANTKWDKCDCQEPLNANILWLERQSCALETEDNPEQIVCLEDPEASWYSDYDTRLSNPNILH